MRVDKNAKVTANLFKAANGKVYADAKRTRPEWVQTGGEYNGQISLFCINPKNGKPWQAGRYFDPSSLQPAGTLDI